MASAGRPKTNSLVDPSRYVIRTQKGLRRFLRVIHGAFLSVVDPRTSRLRDVMEEYDLLTDSDKESLSGKGVFVRRDQARKLWFYLNKMRVDDFNSVVLPELCAHFPNILPDEWQEKPEAAAQEHKYCLRHEIMQTIRPESMADLLFNHECLAYDAYTAIFQSSMTSGQDAVWASLFQALRQHCTQEAAEAVHQLLTRHRVPLPVPVPGGLLQVLSRGVPCTCGSCQRDMPGCFAETTPEDKIAAWLLNSQREGDQHTDSASCTTEDWSLPDHDPADVPFNLDMEAGQRVTLLLLGRTGSGKSSTGNTIFGQRMFDTEISFGSVTSECERGVTDRGGLKIEIIDSPGLFDTHKAQEDICVTIVKAVAGLYPGPHAILYVVRLGRYTQEEYEAFQRIKHMFDEGITRHMIVLFTFGDLLKGRDVDEVMIQKAPETLKRVLRECGHRYVVFNNVARNGQPQVERLLALVQEMSHNGALTYLCPKYSAISQGMEEEVARRLQELEKKDLQRLAYVQRLEEQIRAAEGQARRAREETEAREADRQRRMAQDEAKRQELERQLEAAIREQQALSLRNQELMQRMQDEMMELGTSRRDRRVREKEEDARARQLEAEMRLQRDQEALLQRQCQQQEQLKEERCRFLRQAEEERRQEREALRRSEESVQQLREQWLREDRADTQRKEELYQREMENLKQTVVESNERLVPAFLGTVASALTIYFQLYNLKKVEPK